MLLDVSILTPEKVIFKGRAKSVIIPGEQGVFEILPFHKRILSRLVCGILYIDGRSIPVLRGVINFNQNKATIIVEER